MHFFYVIIMATIKKIDGKTGVSFKITVTHGTDHTGKQVRHYRTWKPAPGMTERQMEKAVQKAALDFEREIEQGYVVDNRQTVSEYCRYVIETKERAGAKHRTIHHYKSLLARIDPAIGHIKLADLRPAHLNAFYTALGKPGVRSSGHTAVARVDLCQLLKDLQLTRDALAKQANVSPTTVTTACRGEKIRRDKAEQIAAVLERKPGDLFTVEKDETALTPKTILEYHRFLHTVLSQAEKEMIVPYNAASKATPPKLPAREPNYFQPEQIVAILDALEAEPIKWRTIVHLLIVTGCRRGEIMGLKWEKVDPDRQQLRIDSTLLYSPDRGVFENATKTGDTRQIALPSETVTLLREYHRWYLELKLLNGDRWNETGYLFVRDDGHPMNPDSIGAWLTGFSKRHGLPHINPHAFRHTVASVLIHSGTDIVSVSKRLGHARTSTTTDLYAHVIQQADEQATEALANALLRKPAKKQA